MTADVADRASRRRVGPAPAAAVAYVVGIFMTAMDMHIVNVALPTLGREFNASIGTVQWTVVAYLLSLAVVIPASGWLGDRIGTKRTFVIALGGFTAASALCGAANGIGELIAARVLQGIGGGMLTPIGTAMLFRAYKPAQRARVARLLIIPIIVAPATAPVVGGVLTQTLSWRWVFLVNVPVGVATLIFCSLFLVEHKERPGGPLDVLGMLLSAAGLSSLMYAISEGTDDGWTSPAILATGIAGMVLLTLFVRISLRRREPLLNLRLLKDRLFRGTNVVIWLTSGAFLGSLYLTPIFLQEVHHQSPIGSGTTTFLEAIGVGVASQSLGRLYPRLGPRVMSFVGGTGVALVLLSFLWIDAGTSLWSIRLAMFMLGFLNSATFLSVQTSMFTTISPGDTSHASAIYTTGRQAAIAAAIAILSTIVAASFSSQLAAFHAAYVAAAAMGIAGAVAALTLIRTADARPTMLARRR